MPTYDLVSDMVRGLEPQFILDKHNPKNRTLVLLLYVHGTLRLL